MAEREQVKPLAPSSSLPTGFNNNNNEEDEAISGRLYFRRKKCIQCCGCVTAFILILAVILIVLAFTVFNVKEPDIRLNGVTAPDSGFNNSQGSLILLADVSVKNPNAFSFRFGNTTTIIYNDGIRIGEGKTPPGKAKPRRSLRLNVTLAISSTLLESTGLRSDQALNISTYTRIDGKVKVLNVFKRTVVVEMNCTVEYNIMRGSAQGENCLRRVKI